jgi:hypothetical protein
MRLLSMIFLVVVSIVVFARDANAQSAGALYDQNQQIVGLFAGLGPGQGVNVGTYVHTLRGFRFLVDTRGRVLQIEADVGGENYGQGIPAFESMNCTGPAFLRVSSETPAGGVVTRLGSSVTSLGYVQKAPLVFTITVRSLLDNGTTCLPVTPPQPAVGVPFLPNDPAVTGVPNADFVPPLRLEVVPVSALFDLFRDGFESAGLAATRPELEAVSDANATGVLALAA